MITVRRLVWDDFNVPHIARHDVTPDEAEVVCHGVHIVREAYGGRIMLIGPTLRRRMLAVFLAPELEADVYYPVTARRASRKERAIYDRSQKGQEP
jgi:uncharacterized DUF497 family protein